MRNTATTIIPALILALAAGSAAASTWCGENGVIRFDFGEGDSLVTVYDAGPADQGVTRVTVRCWLDGVDPVAVDGEAFLNVGGFELSLDVTGAEVFIVGQEIPAKSLDVSNRKGTIAAGLNPGLGIEDGRVLLVTWNLMFQGRPEDVRIGLAPDGASSCATLEGCPEEGIPCIYVGDQASGQLTYMFGAGYEPAWLNPAGTPDQEPVHAGPSWREVGVYEARQVR